MAKFPDPPGVSVLRATVPIIHRMPAGTLLTRIYFAGGPYPAEWDAFRHFGPTASRFDHHLPGTASESDGRMQARGILYAASGARAFPTCLAEVFQTARTVDRSVRDPVVCYFHTVAPLDLLDLTGTFATRIGASMAIGSGPRPRARRWSRSLYEAFPDAHGILYASSMYANAPALALFERATYALPEVPSMRRALADPMLASVMRSTAMAIGFRWR